MLFDEKDLSVFDNTDSRDYFMEILQSYYSKNYRATIVLLYSFVIYDLFIKLQTMANEGDKKASSKLKEINDMIENDEKYSSVENEIIRFFKENCQLYFNRFTEDVDYLKNCRNKCAHLKVNDNTLYVPSDYHARMLICSMYDHIFSVKAPFIMDLFPLAQSDVEAYAKTIYYISGDGFDESIKNSIENKYLSRMTFDSLKKSYKTFFRLLFVSDNAECIENTYGLYAFAYVMTGYMIKKGYTATFSEILVPGILSRITVDTLEKSDARRNALIKIILDYPVIMDIIRSNEGVFAYLSNLVLGKPQFLKYYGAFHPRSEKSVYAFFMENPGVQQAGFSTVLYDTVKDSEDFNLAEFTHKMVNAIPHYAGFDAADNFTNFFINHLQDLSIDDIKSVMSVYSANAQCTNRGRHSTDIATINEYIAAHSAGDGGEVEQREG